MPLPIKSIFGNDIRRLALGEAKFDLLRKHIIEAYEISNFSVQYTDDDGDLVSISSDCELVEAFNIVRSGTLKVFVTQIIPQQVVLEIEQGEPLPEQELQGPFPEQELQGPLPEQGHPAEHEQQVSEELHGELIEPQEKEERELTGEPLVSESAEHKKGWAVSKIKRVSTVVRQTYHHLTSPPLFVRCPNCIRTLAVPPPAAPLGQAPGEDSLSLRVPVPPVDRRVMACPHCNGVFRVPSTVAWEQINYITARLRLAVVAFWDNVCNRFAYLFRNQSEDASEDAHQRSTVTTKVWTEKKIAALYKLMRRKSVRVPEELHEDDVVRLHQVDQEGEEEVEASAAADEANDAGEAKQAEVNVADVEEALEAAEEAAEVEGVEVEDVQRDLITEVEATTEEEDRDLLTLAGMGFLNSERNLELLRANGLQQTVDILLHLIS